ncbi:MAG: hypothetical protein CMO34_07930 [Verrucomicrobia bacterium]|nr:hypothetical protein [Verrucomicrobiota bacterium]
MGLALFLGACGEGNGNRGADGYQFIEEQYVQEQFTTEVRVYDSRNDLHRAFRAIASEQGISSDEIAGRIEDIQAFSELSPNGTYCRVHIFHPEVEYIPEFYGHEFAHCVFGQWHKDNATQ